MIELLDILEPICDKEEINEIGPTLEEEKVQQEIYEHHTATVTVADEGDDTGGEGDESADDPVDVAVPYDVLTHFLAD